MADLSFDNDVKDIELLDGDLKLTSDDSITEGIRQDVIARLQTFQGEYFLDDSGTTVGVPWIQEIFRAKPLSSAKADRIISTQILETPGVASVDQLTITFETTNRALIVDWIALTDDGVLITDNIQIG
jgi:hypothetical protein